MRWTKALSAEFRRPIRATARQIATAVQAATALHMVIHTVIRMVIHMAIHTAALQGTAIKTTGITTGIQATAPTATKAIFGKALQAEARIRTAATSPTRRRLAHSPKRVRVRPSSSLRRRPSVVG